MSSQRCELSLPTPGSELWAASAQGLLAKFSIPSRLLGQDNPEPWGLGPIFCCPVSQTSPADTEHPVWQLRSRFQQLGPRWGPGTYVGHVFASWLGSRGSQRCLLTCRASQPPGGAPAVRPQVSGNYSPMGGLPSLLTVAPSLCSSSPLVSLQRLRFPQGQLHKL